MSQTLTVSLVGGVLGAETRSGTSVKTGQPWSFTDVTILTPRLDKFKVRWPDDEQPPQRGTGVRVLCVLSGTQYGLEGRCESWQPTELPPAVQGMVDMLTGDAGAEAA